MKIYCFDFSPQYTVENSEGSDDHNSATFLEKKMIKRMQFSLFSHSTNM